MVFWTTVGAVCFITSISTKLSREQGATALANDVEQIACPGEMWDKRACTVNCRILETCGPCTVVHHTLKSDCSTTNYKAARAAATKIYT